MFLDHIVPEDRKAVEAQFQQAIISGEAWDFECRIRRADGAQRWIEARGRAYPAEEGLPHRMVGIVADITERKRLEEELQDTRSRLEAALEAGAIATWTWDIPNNRLSTDERLTRLFGLNPSEAEGGLLDKYIQSIHPEDWPSVSAALSRSAERGEDYEADYRIRQAGGSVRWVVARGRVERDESGRPARMPGVLVDITERKRLEEELRVRINQLAEADRRKDEFLATLAHELRNPLAAILHSLQILTRPHVDAVMAQQTQAIMRRQIHLVIRIVDDLLDVSRIMRGKIELRKGPVELATVVARAVEMAQPLIDAQEHTLELSLPPDSLHLTADPIRLAQVIANLLTNAAKYTKARGHITLSARHEGEAMVLRVRDNGIGIAPDKLSQIFEWFVQIDPTTPQSQGGLGLGLTLVKSLVEMHGGAVEAYSAGLGQGCEFVIRLPCRAEAYSERGPKGGEPPQPDPLPSGHRLLVVDDNEDAALSLAMLLRLQGHEVRIVHDGVSALEMASTYRPMLIFLDIGMPEMDGYEVARRMRRTPGLEKTVLVALTGWGQAADRRRTRAAGFDHHLVKPASLAALQQVLGSAQESPRDERR